MRKWKRNFEGYLFNTKITFNDNDVVDKCFVDVWCHGNEKFINLYSYLNYLKTLFYRQSKMYKGKTIQEIAENDLKLDEEYKEELLKKEKKTRLK